MIKTKEMCYHCLNEVEAVVCDNCGIDLTNRTGISMTVSSKEPIDEYQIDACDVECFISSVKDKGMSFSRVDTVVSINANTMEFIELMSRIK